MDMIVYCRPWLSAPNAAGFPQMVPVVKLREFLAVWKADFEIWW